MKIAGVICEYNPFHNGHAYHLNAARAAGATHIVAAMSGCFVQRGTGAFCDPWARARAAVRCGADLVLETGVPFSCAGAGVFARGGVETLRAFGVHTLCFGAETDDLSLLQRAADAVSDAEVQQTVRALHANGTGYPAAVRRAVETIFGDAVASVLDTPNNTLATEYLNAARKLGAPFSFLPVRRVGAAHHASAPVGRFADAKTLRRLSSPEAVRPFLPQKAYEEIFSPQTLFFDRTAYETAVLCALRALSLPEIERCVADGSGLAQRIFAASRSACSLDALYMTAKTKSVTLSKVRRAVLHCFLRLDRAWQTQTPPYLRVLAVNRRGLELLHQAAPTLLLLTKHRETSALSAQAREYYEMQCRAADLYAAVCKPKGVCGLEQKNSMLVLSE